MIKRVLIAFLALLVVSCSFTTIGVVVAGLGIAGAALQTYCTVNVCPPVLTMYAPIIVSEAVTDVGVLESGATTEVKIAEIISNVQTEIAQGQSISGLSAEELRVINPILNSLSAFLDMLNGLKPPPADGHLEARRNAVVTLPKLTVKDQAKIKEMKAKVATLKPIAIFYGDMDLNSTLVSITFHFNSESK